MSEHIDDGLEIDELRMWDQSGIRYDIEDALDRDDVPHVPWWMGALASLGVVFAVVLFGLFVAGVCMVSHG